MIQEFSFGQGGRQVNAKGLTFRYEQGSAQGESVAVRVRADGSDLGTYLPGDMCVLESPASRFDIVPVSGLCVGVVRIGQARFSTSRVSGEVAVTDRSFVRSFAQRAFGVHRQAVGNGGWLLEHQIWNPAASGKLVVVNLVKAWSQSPLLIHVNAVQLLTLQPSAVGFWSASMRGGDTLAAAGASAEIRFPSAGQQRAAIGAMTVGVVAQMSRLTANDEIRFTDQAVVMPGTGLSVVPQRNDLNYIIDTSVYWVEIPLSDT